MKIVGLDIGGTKCAMCLAEVDKKTLHIELLEKEVFLTNNLPPQIILDNFSKFIEKRNTHGEISSIGIACGGPLDSKKGVIMCPPSLPLWDNIEIVKYFKDKFNIPVYLQNDANAGAVAEFKFGAGKGYNNIIFITFGTGFGAGLILNGKLYVGANDNAGEIGHVRLTDDGPNGYFKNGSVEGYCSGSGIKRLAKIMYSERLKGKEDEDIQSHGGIDKIDAKTIAELARNGNEFCKSVYEKSGEMLGKTLSILIDIFNPELIIIGGVFMRSQDLLIDKANEQILKECLPQSRKVCKIVKSYLGENIGDYSAVSVALGDN